jgi:hypothetical protein
MDLRPYFLAFIQRLNDLYSPSSLVSNKLNDKGPSFGPILQKTYCYMELKRFQLIGTDTDEVKESSSGGVSVAKLICHT